MNDECREHDDVFSPSHGWCDRWCERCVLRGSCPIAEIARVRREARAASGQPDGVEECLADVSADLARCLVMLHDQARERGIDLDNLEPVPTSAAGDRLRNLGIAYATAVHRILRWVPWHADHERVDELASQASIVAAKLARLSSYFDAPDEPESGFFLLDGVPNLLLLEVVAQRIHLSVEELFDEAGKAIFESFHDQINRCLQPLYAQIPSEARAELAQRVARFEAPSPFIIQQPDG